MSLGGWGLRSGTICKLLQKAWRLAGGSSSSLLPKATRTQLA